MVDDAFAVRMARRFGEISAREFRGESTVYERLALSVAARPALAAPMRGAADQQQRALLLFAAVQFVLRTLAPTHPLAAYYPTLGGTRAPDASLEDAFADVVASHATALAKICQGRTTQTNEARRAAYLWPALGEAGRHFQGHPLSLIELGTSAGLLLIPDRYGYLYRHPGGATTTTGRPDAPDALVMTCDTHGDVRPPTDAPLLHAARVGIDMHPIPADDEDSAQWLRSCVWPEHVERLARLDAALAAVAEAKPHLIAGDMVARLPEALDGVAPGTVPCVFTSHALTYLPSAARRDLIAMFAEVGARRDLAVILNEGADVGVRQFAADAPALAGSTGVLALVTWRDGVRVVRSLADAGPHGAWLRWQPVQYP
jgi:hypothetical protein